MSTDADTERTAVKTYVPAYQKERWSDHAEDLDASLSEFVRTMVQAGRRGFGGDVAVEDLPSAPAAGEGDSTPADAETGDPPPAAAADGGVDLEDWVVEALADEPALPWDDLLAAVTGDVESRLEEALQTLQSDGRVQHSGRLGGYTLTDDER